MNTRAFLQSETALAAAAGLLFGAGLAISGMIDPQKVLGFLDIGAIATGGWDPSLALVIGPAIGFMFVAARLTRGRRRPLVGTRFHLPERHKVDFPLIAGAALFGVGWGLSGVCPGPAICLVAFMPANLLVFLTAMFAGLFAGGVLMQATRQRPALS